MTGVALNPLHTFILGYDGGGKEKCVQGGQAFRFCHRSLVLEGPGIEKDARAFSVGGRRSRFEPRLRMKAVELKLHAIKPFILVMSQGRNGC